MRTLMTLVALALPTALPAGTPEQSVVKIKFPSGSFCSGVSVSDGLVLTAEHCGFEDNVTVIFRDGTTIKADGVYDPPKQSRDQVTVYRLKDAAPHSVAVATKRPSRGDSVRSIGYPGGKFSTVEGKITSSSSQLMFADFWILEGNSGGGLFNKDGNLVGIASARTDLNDKPGSMFIPVDEIHVSLAKVDSKKLTVADYTKSNEVVVFTTPECPPCQRLKADIKAGHFSKFNVRVVEFRAGVWSDQAIVDEFFGQIPDDAVLAFPTIWVRGTENYRAGYSPDRRGGLLGFLGSVLRGLGNVVLGEATPKEFPRPYRRNRDDAVPGPPEKLDVAPMPEADNEKEVSELESKLDSLRADIEKLKSANPLDKIRGAVALKSDIAELQNAVKNNKPDLSVVDSVLADVKSVKSDLDTLKSGNPIAKIAALSSLKGDVAKLKSDAENVKDKAKDDPLLFLLGLPGLLTGLLHRRMAA